MGVENLKWWHWVAISLVIGYALAYANSQPPEPVGFTEQQVVEFERDVMHAPVGEAQTPWVRHLIVYPVTEKAALGRPAQIILYEALAHKDNAPANEYYYRKCWFCASVPYVPTNQRPITAAAAAQFVAEAKKATGDNALPPGIERLYVPKPEETLESITATVYGKFTGAGQEAIATANQPFRFNHSIEKLIQIRRWSAGRAVLIPWNPSEHKTVQDWLNGEAKNYSWVHYQFAWWKVPQYCNAVWVGSTFAIIGVIWPMTLSVMSGAGLGRSPKKETDGYDPRRFATGSKAKMPASKSQEMTQEHKEQLTALNESLAASVKEGIGAGQTPPPTLVGPQIPGRQFTPTAAAEASSIPVPGKPQESRDFTGEFYPVARPTVKTEPESSNPAEIKKAPHLP